jgi:hypothetical protein
MRFLHLIRPVMCVLPEVSTPDRKVSFCKRMLCLVAVKVNCSASVPLISSRALCASVKKDKGIFGALWRKLPSCIVSSHLQWHLIHCDILQSMICCNLYFKDSSVFIGMNYEQLQ